jgi:Uma2 family endonuclease
MEAAIVVANPATAKERAMNVLAAELEQKARENRVMLAEEQHFFLSGVSWDSYLAIGNALPDRPGLRLTYDGGSLEFMTTSSRHEIYKKWLSRFIETIAEELNRPIAPGGHMTMQRADLDKGIEGDDIYWIENELAMRGKLTWVPEVDPPPDLALEIEVSRSVINRLDIYAALRIPEVWTFDGSDIRVRWLQPDGTYQLSDTSKAFPEVPVHELVRFVVPDPDTDFLTAVRNLRTWLRQLLGKSANG